MTVGNLLALVQTNIKRLLGYSSIAQAGYFMVGLAAISAVGGLSAGASSVLFFIGAYAVTNLGAFIVVIAISNRTGSDQISDYAGLCQRAPWSGCCAGPRAGLADRHPADRRASSPSSTSSTPPSRATWSGW